MKNDEKKEAPDFEGMSMFELFKYAHENSEFKSGGFDEWLKAIEGMMPFATISARVDDCKKSIEITNGQFYELQAQFERLVLALDKQLEPVNVSLKEWIKR